MSLKALLGDAYREDMTAAEIEAALAGRRIVDADSLPKMVSKEVFDKTASELARYKKELKALQEQNMTAEERLKAELEKAQEMQASYAKELSKLRAKEVFVEAGLKEDEYESILEMVVSDDTDATVVRAKAMIDLIESQKKAVEKAVKAQLLKDTPKPPAGAAPGGAMTKEDFRKLTLAEKQRFAKENRELYEAFYKEE